MATVQRRASNPVRLTGEFIRNESYNVSEGNSSWWEKFKTFMMSHYVANLMAVIVCVDTFCTCSEIDARAADGGQPSPGILLISDICLTLYSTEVLLLLVITGLPILKDWMMLLDLGIVVCGWVEVIIVQTITHEGLTFPIKVLRVLRLVRIFRPIRLLKRIRGLRELYKLSMMMATCFRTLAWCFLMCFVVMTGWAMLMVELVNPLVKEVKDINPGTWDGCTDCIDSMSSVMHANLLLFKTVIAGDSWGQIAVPLIQEHPETAIIFVGSLLTLVFGVVNLIVAVVVDTFADARQNDVQNLAEEMEDEIEHDRKALSKLFQRIDKDGSGQLTLRELIEGARHDKAFQSRLRVMDIDEHDLEQLFHMIDLDESGTIEISEFIGPLSRWAHDSKTAPRFIKYNMLQSMHLQQDLYDLSVDCFRELAARIDDVALQVHRQRPAPPTPAPPVPAPAFAETVKGPESGHETSQTDSTLDTEPHLWSKLHEVQQEANQMHGQSAEILGLSIEAIMVNLEAKLDMLLQESRKPRLNKSDSLRSLRSRFAPGPTSMSTDKYGFRRPLGPTAFRSLYMKSRSMRVPGQDGGGSSESYNTFAARFGWPKTRFRTNEQDPSWTLSDAGLPVEKLQSIEEDADDLKTMETSRI